MKRKAEFSDVADAKRGGSQHWSYGLHQATNDPKKILLQNECAVAIKDIYPKARHHYQVVSKVSVSSVSDLGVEHLSLLKDMFLLGESVANTAKQADPNLEFVFGFHAVPSMNPLHMHVISTDYDSVWLKTKKHWNSFTTAFFLPYDSIVSMLEAHGKVNVDKVQCGNLLKVDLCCHKCKLCFRNMPSLKHHLLSHLRK